MSDTTADGSTAQLVLEFDMDAPVEKVWRAIDRPDLRARWLPGRLLTDAEDLTAPGGREVRFRMRDDDPPFVETTVTFQVRPRVGGGSILTITQRVPDLRALGSRPMAANRDCPPLMRAA